MQSQHENCCLCCKLLDTRLWKIVPSFLRRRLSEDNNSDTKNNLEINRTDDKDAKEAMIVDTEKHDDNKEVFASVRVRRYTGQRYPGLDQKEVKKRLLIWRRTTIVRKYCQQ